MPSPPPITSTPGSPIAANTTPVYVAYLTDSAGNPISSGQLTTLTLTICDTGTGAIINSCSQVNILNTDRGTVDGDGKLTVTLEIGDTSTDEAPGAQSILRSLVFDWTYNGGTSAGRHQTNFTIVALAGP